MKAANAVNATLSRDRLPFRGDAYVCSEYIRAGVTAVFIEASVSDVGRGATFDNAVLGHPALNVIA
jgi:hypothetical protein